MKWAQKQHAVETVAEWGAPALLAASAGWAGLRLGVPVAGTASLIGLAFAAGLLVMRRADPDRPVTIAPFEAPAIEPVASELEELVLESKDELLTLDDPLVEPTPDSRVVRLFARQEPTPGELVDLIADFLGEGRGLAPAAQQSAAEQPIVDASAALHAALANIRASLR
jgi:hypothetical protein